MADWRWLTGVAHTFLGFTLLLVESRRVDSRLGRRRLSIVVFSLLILAGFYVSVVAFLFASADPWTEDLLGDPLANGGVMTIDDNGGLHMAFVGYTSIYDLTPDATFLEYAYMDSTDRDGNWSKTRILKLEHSTPVSLAVDSQNKAHICTNVEIRDESNSPTGNWTITYATNRDGDWAVEQMVVQSRIASSMVAITPDDAVHLIVLASNPYFWNLSHPQTQTLVDYVKVSAGWEPTNILTFPNSTESNLFSVAVGPEGSLCILTSTVYLTEDILVTSSYLNFTTNRGGMWTQSMVAFRNASWSDQASMVLDQTGNPHVCYYRIEVGKDISLVYSNVTNGEWTRSTIGWTGHQYSGNGITVDAHGHIHVAYFAGISTRYVLNFTVRHAEMVGGVWKVEEVADRRGSSPEHSGYEGAGTIQYASVAVDSRDQVHLAYRYVDKGWNPPLSETLHYDQYVCYSMNAPSGQFTEASMDALWYLIPGAAAIAFSCYLFRRRLVSRAAIEEEPKQPDR